MDETKVQIGNEVLLNVGINPDWYISSVGYEYGYEEKAREVTITLRNKGDENKLWRTLGELITDHKDEPQTEIEWWDCIDHRDMEHHVYCTPKIDESRYEPQTETDKDLKEVRIAVARAKAFKTSDIDEPLTKCDLCKREGDDICADCERKKQSGKE